MTEITTEYKTRVSIRYHQKRERFFRIIDSIGKGISVLAIASFGATAISGGISAAVGVISVAFTILSVALDFPGMASRHSTLAQRFLDLLAGIEAETLDGPRQIVQFHKIAKDEPPPLRGLGQLCQDEQDAAEGKDVPLDRLSVWRGAAAQFGFGQRAIDYEHTKTLD